MISFVLIMFLLAMALFAALFVLSACSVASQADNDLEMTMLISEKPRLDSAEIPNSR